MSDLLYLYGVVPAGADVPPDDLTGVGGSPVEVLEVAEMGAVVSRVPAEEYGSEAVERRLRDLDWLGDQGALHERVVTWFVDHSRIVPVRLLTLYSGEEALRSSLDERAARLHRDLERTRGLREWNLKIACDRAVLRENLPRISEAVAAMDREIAEADPGRRYLLERKREKRLEEETGAAARSLAGDVLDAASRVARETRTVPPPRSEGTVPVVLNAALLVSRDDEEALRRAVDEAAGAAEDAGLTVALTGPWAPYRFVGGDREEASP